MLIFNRIKKEPYSYTDDQHHRNPREKAREINLIPVVHHTGEVQVLIIYISKIN